MINNEIVKVYIKYELSRNRFRIDRRALWQCAISRDSGLGSSLVQYM